MRIAEIVRDMRQVLAGDIQPARMIRAAGRQNDSLRVIRAPACSGRLRSQRETVAVARVPRLTTRRLEPMSGWRWPSLRDAWTSRELLFFFVWRDVKVRYKQTVLGALWAILQPVLAAIVASLRVE